MPIPSTTGAFAIVPSNNLPAAIAFWERLGFERTGGDATYIIMTGWGCEVHVSQAGDGPWRVPEEHNPYGVFIRTPEVDSIAARVDDLIIRPGGVLRRREWGLYEMGIQGPDGMLVRIGWPSRLMGRGSVEARATEAAGGQTDVSQRSNKYQVMTDVDLEALWEPRNRNGLTDSDAFDVLAEQRRRREIGPDPVGQIVCQRCSFVGDACTCPKP